MKLEVSRIWPNSACTIGTLSVDGAPLCFTLEDVVREVPGQPVATWKVFGQTAIPRGTYKVVVSHSQHFGCDLPELLDVPGYVGVRIHPGNVAADTEGCILVGMDHLSDSIGRSRIAFGELMPKIKAAIASGEEITIEVE